MRLDEYLEDALNGDQKVDEATPMAKKPKLDAAAKKMMVFWRKHLKGMYTALDSIWNQSRMMDDMVGGTSMQKDLEDAIKRTRGQLDALDSEINGTIMEYQNWDFEK